MTHICAICIGTYSLTQANIVSHGHTQVHCPLHIEVQAQPCCRKMPTHLCNVESRFHCPQAFLSLGFQCRGDVFGLKYICVEIKKSMMSLSRILQAADLLCCGEGRTGPQSFQGC